MRFIPATLLLCVVVFGSVPAVAAARCMDSFIDCAGRGEVQLVQAEPVRGRGGVSTAGLVAPLAAKVADIQVACPGTVVISAVRHTLIAGTRVLSLHATGQAVDVTGNYGCIYGQLEGWAGGYSTDAVRMRHIHIAAPDSREAGLRFTHGASRRHAHKRYAAAR